MKQNYFETKLNLSSLPKTSNSFRLLLILLLFTAVEANAQTKTWNGLSSTNWNADNNWTPSGVPNNTSNVVIPNVNRKPVISVAGAVCATLIISSGDGSNTLTINSPGSLAVTGAITMTSPTDNTNNTVINVASGTLTAASIRMNNSGDSDRDASLRIGTGSVTINGNITMDGINRRNDITFTGTGTLNVGGTITGGTLNAGTGTVNYNNPGAQNIGSYVYYNLTLSGGNTKTFASSTTVGDVLSIATGVKANLGTYTHTVGSLTLGGVSKLLCDSWGSSASAAGNKDDVFFTATIGIIRGSNSLAAPNISFDQRSNEDTANVTVCGEIGGGREYDIDILSGDTGTRQWEYSLVSNAGPWVADANTGNQYFVSSFASAPGTYYFRLRITTSGGCPVYSDVIVLKVTGTAKTAPTGTGASRCGTGALSLTASTSIAGATLRWYNAQFGGTFLGSGTTFTIPSLSATTTYYVAARDTAGCESPRTAVTATVDQLPAITIEPSSQLDCESRSVKFKVVATGALTYVWQRKRLSDASFTAIANGETNVTYPSPGEIKIDNIGSAQAPDGTQYRVVVSNGSCNVTSTAATLSVNEIKDISSPALTPAQSVLDAALCYGANYSYTVSTSYPTNVVSYQWKRSVALNVWTDVVDGAHFSGAKTASLTINSGTPAESAAYRVYITFKSSGADCNGDSSSRTRKLTFLPELLTPAVAILQPDCIVATGKLTVTVQNTDDVYSFDGGNNFQASNVKSGLAAGIYKVIIKNKSECRSTTTDCTLKAAVTSTWNGAAWLPSTPTKEDRIVFAGNYISSGNLEGCSCEVNSGIKVTISSGNTLSITNGLTVNTATGTSLTFEDTASLWQENDAAENTGKITYKRKSSFMKLSDYTYWSSPVKGQNTKDLSPNTETGKFYSFVSNNWKPAYNVTMDPGIGYIIRTPKAGTWGVLGAANYEVVSFPYKQPVQFVGEPNNGDQIKFALDPIAGRKNLIGNPYPSALDANAFLLENQAILEGTIYFWTHNTAIQQASNITNGTAGSGFYAYTSDDYAAYNSLGGVGGTAKSKPDPNNPVGGDRPSGKIAAGQSFMAVTKVPGVVSFKNSMREKASNTQFFKQTKNAKTTTAGRQRVWLNLTNTEGAFKQTLIGYIKGATNGYEDFFDGIKNNGNSFVDFYSINDNTKLVIQGRALPFDPADVVPLGYSSNIEGAFAISIDEVDGDLSNQSIFIEDKETQTIHDLKSGSYSFTTKKGIFNERFALRYTNKTLGSGDFETTDNTVVVTVKNKHLKVYSATEAIDKVLVYDLSGRQLYKKERLNNTEVTVQYINSGTQALVVKVVLENGKIVSKKVIY